MGKHLRDYFYCLCVIKMSIAIIEMDGNILFYPFSAEQE